MEDSHLANSDEYLQNHLVTWADVHRDSKILVRTLLNLGPWRGIVALTRGGLVPAAILAREMDIRVVDTLCVATYDGQNRGNVDILKIPIAASEVDGKGWLLIDDLVDTGTTALAARRILPESHFATVYAKPAGRPHVDTHVHNVSQDTWVFFPWDTEPQYVQPIAGVSGA